MSVRQDKPAGAPGAMPVLELQAAAEGTAEPLGEGNSFAVAAPDHPLKRNVVVSIKASLNDLCLQKARGTWAPTQEALRNIFQQVSRRPPGRLSPNRSQPATTATAINPTTPPPARAQPAHPARLPTDRPCARPVGRRSSRAWTAPAESDGRPQERSCSTT